jgi:hypothetical protein
MSESTNTVHEEATNNTINEQAPTNDGRDELGRFTLGNLGGPGNPFARQCAGLRKALLNRVTDQDMEECADKLLEMSKSGNLAAMKLLFTYVIGKPQPATDPDRVDVDEWQIYRETNPMKEEAATLIKSGTPQQHIDLVRLMRPVIAEINRQEMISELDLNEIAKDGKYQPKPNGRNRQNGRRRRRSRRGKNGQHHPSQNGKNGQHHPSQNGKNGQHHPSPNGQNGKHPPIANGKNGQQPPTANGETPPSAADMHLMSLLGAFGVTEEMLAERFQVG